ncbi:hypothetical protein ABZ446_01820 [Streptomyces sp. NPDC005813]|uniref:DUF6907 domain-containing protein n=1 Tax=Streptomyces sp. NPDC005813 TaxID=3155592 RepID=UPI0033FBD31F
MSIEPPRFTPTLVNKDEDTTPDIIVTVAYGLTRQQLVTALADSWSEIAADTAADALTVDETRSEIEGWLAAQGLVELDQITERDRHRDHTPEQQAIVAQLAEAVERAYPPPAEPPARQQPRYRDGHVTLLTIDRGEITVPEPAWCTGHDNELVGYLADVTHNGPETSITATTKAHGPITVLRACISHAPHAVQQPERHPLISVHGDLDADVDPADAWALSRALRRASARIDRLTGELIRLRGESR